MMMLTIHGLPYSMKYPDIKVMIRQRCNVNDFILDQLLPDGVDGTKKVRVGVTDDKDGSTLIRTLHGYRMGVTSLTVLPVNKSEGANIPPAHGYGNQANLNMQRNNYNQGSNQWQINNQQEPDQTLNSGPWAEGPWSSNQQSYNHQQPGNNFGNMQGPSSRFQDAAKTRFQPQPGRSPTGVQKNAAFGNVGGDHRQLRSVELVAEGQFSRSNSGHNQDKPQITIMKDNFQGSSQNFNQSFAGPTSAAWETKGSRNMDFNRGFNQGTNQRPEGRIDDRMPLHSRGYERSAAQGMSTSRLQDAAQMGRNPSPNARRPISPRSGQRPISPKPQIRAISPNRLLQRSASGQRPHSPNRLLQRPAGFTEDMSGRRNPLQRPISPDYRPPPSDKRPVSPSYPLRPVSPTMPLITPSRRLSPRSAPPGRQFPDRRMSPGRRPISPRRGSPDSRQMSPGRRPMSPGRKRPISPGRRPMSPGRRPISPGRRPNIPGRRPISPDRRPISPGRRPISPGRRPMSPGKRPLSPGRRPMSPGRPSTRFSPRRDIDEKFSKRPRSPYDSDAGAPNPMYSGGYRPNVQEKEAAFISSSIRKIDPMNSPWQGERDKAAALMKQLPGNIHRMPFEGPRDQGYHRDVRSGIDRVSPGRRSRSPNPRSPPKDQFRRSSLSPPGRRHWQTTMEAPPPPMWPGQEGRDEEPFQKRARPDAEPPKSSKSPTWERSMDRERGMRHQTDRRFEVRRDYAEPMRRDPSPRRGFKREDDVFVPVKADLRRQSPNSRQLDMDMDLERKPNFQEVRREIDQMARLDEVRRRIAAPEIFRQVENLDKEFDDIHRRALEFRKKAEAVKRQRDDSRKHDETPKEAYHNVEPYYDSSRKYDLERRDTRQKFDRSRSRDRRSISLERRPRSREDRRSPERRRSHERRSRSPISREDRPRDHREQPKQLRKDRALPAAIKAKRDKAIDEIADKILKRHKLNYSIEIQSRIFEKLKLEIARHVNDMFEDKDVSFIEIVVKFGAKYNHYEESKMFREALRGIKGFPDNVQVKKRPAESIEASTKMAKRLDPESPSNPKDAQGPALNIDAQGWKLNPDPMSMVPPMMIPAQFTPNQFDPALGLQMYPMLTTPMMVPAPSVVHNIFDLQETATQSRPQNKPEEYNMYLCKEDFEAFTPFQAEYLRKFLFSEIYKTTEQSSGWTPTFTIKGLQSNHRFEMSTSDAASKDWLTNLSFEDFKYFQVLVYTKEELWYERAAIWLPGHSKYKNISPLDKIKLQNGHLKDVNFDKWKLVKKIIMNKGIRIYVDMPPSSARALEKYKMLLSYELHKVTVFLKAVAIDKEAFDMGLKEISLNETEQLPDMPMPSIADSPDLVKIALKGNKHLSSQQAKKVKDIMVYHLFKYLQSDKSNVLTFLNYGFCQPGYLGILPEHNETKRWLISLDIGKINRHPITVIGGESLDIRYIRMEVTDIPIGSKFTVNPQRAQERLRQANQGVKGLYFKKWKPIRLVNMSKSCKYIVDIDLESVETLEKMNFLLDYKHENGKICECLVRHPHSMRYLKEEMAKHKAELSDKYDVANMDLDSGSEKDDDDVILVN